MRSDSASARICIGLALIAFGVLIFLSVFLHLQGNPSDIPPLDLSRYNLLYFLQIHKQQPLLNCLQNQRSML